MSELIYLNTTCPFKTHYEKRVHYAKTRHWNGFYFKGSGITLDGVSHGYVDIERKQEAGIYLFESKSDKITNALFKSKCWKFKQQRYFNNSRWHLKKNE